MSIDHKKRINTTIDLILLVLLLISLLYFLAEMVIGALLPTVVMIIISVLLFAIFFLIFFFIIKQTKVSWSRRLITVLISILLLICSLYQSRIRSAFNSVDTTQTSYNHISVVVHKNSQFNSISDLQEKVVGIISDDEENNDYALKSLQEDDSLTLDTELYATYQEGAIALMNNQIDVLIVNDVNYSLMKDMYIDFYANTEILEDFYRPIKINESAIKKDLTNEPFTIYLSAMDQLGPSNITSKSDVNMIVMVDPKRHHIELISLLRDTYVPNIAYGSYPDKLTHTGNNGIDNTVKSVEAVFGFNIDFYAKASFSSLIDAVNTLNGINIDVPITFCEQDENRDFDHPICLETGLQTLNGSQALALARHRHSYSDIERTAAQQQIVKAIFQKTLSLNGMSKIPDLLQVVASNVSTNVNIDDLKAFISKELEKQQAWTFGSTSLSSGITSTQPCISWDPAWPLSVYILSNQDIATVYEKYLTMFNVIELHNFGFNLNSLNSELLMPPVNPNLVTVENFGLKIAEFYTLLPDYTIQPLVPKEKLDIHEKEEGRISIEIDGPIFDSETLEGKK